MLVATGLVAEGKDRCLDAILQSEFGEDTADVGLDGLLANRQVPGDQPEYFAFARRKRLRHMVARQRELRIEVMRGLLFEAADLDPAAIAQTQRLWESLTERAAKRGEIGAGPVPHYVRADLLRYRMLVSAEEVTDNEIDRLVDDVFLPLIRSHAGAWHPPILGAERERRSGD